MDQLPEDIDPETDRVAELAITRIEQKRGLPIEELYVRYPFTKYPEEMTPRIWGHYFGMQALGHGVGLWEYGITHEMLDVPYIGGCGLANDYYFETGTLIENVSCKDCGRIEIPLHLNGQCGNCFQDITLVCQHCGVQYDESFFVEQLDVIRSGAPCGMGECLEIPLFPRMSYDEFCEQVPSIAPHIIADSIGANREETDFLVDKLLTVCYHNEVFLKQCKSAKGRDHIYAFMEHWKLALDKQKH